MSLKTILSDYLQSCKINLSSRRRSRQPQDSDEEHERNIRRARISRESVLPATVESQTSAQQTSALQSFRRFAGSVDQVSEASVAVYTDLDVANDFTQLLNNQCDEQGDC